MKQKKCFKEQGPNTAGEKFMRIFLATLKVHLKVMIQYKWSHLASLLVDPIILLINIALFTSIYSYNKTNQVLGYSLTQMIWYFAVVTFVWYFIWNSTDQSISSRVLSGSLTMDLLKPLSIFQYEFAQAVALRVGGIVFEFLPSIFLYSLMRYPDFLTAVAFLKFLAVISLAFVLYFLINFLIGLSAFVIKSNYSVQSIKFFVISLAAGAYIPLEFFPNWLNRIFSYLPFQYLFYWPIQIFLNKGDSANTSTFITILLQQMLWIAALYVCCRFAWSRAVKKYCAVGG